MRHVSDLHRTKTKGSLTHPRDREVPRKLRGTQQTSQSTEVASQQSADVTGFILDNEEAIVRETQSLESGDNL